MIDMDTNILNEQTQPVEENTQVIQPITPDESPPMPCVPTLDENITTVAQQVMDCQDVDESKKLVDLFNWNISKKNVARVQQLNNLFDKVTKQMETRLEKKADEFSNGDLLQYMNALQNAAEKSQNALAGVSTTPAIQVQNNTQVNVNVLDTFDRDSKQRIADAIKQILAQSAQPPVVTQDVEQPIVIADTPVENDNSEDVEREQNNT